MENQEFIVLYTHQKMKKSKVWQDGILKITPLGNKAILYDDKGACLESLFLKCLEVKPGDDLESDRYLITVEEVKMSGSITIKQNVIKEPQSDSRRFISYGRSLGCQPAGLKRKFPGFQAPRQVPKKMVLTENGESAASLESKEPGPTFSSPFYNIPPLFSTVGKQDINNIPRNSENIVTYNIGERNNMTSPSVVSASSFMINPEMLAEENYFCSPVSTESQHSDSSLTNEPLRRDNLALHYPGVSQNIRSKAQILALLKSKSTNMHKDLNSEMTRLLPQVQPQRSSNIPANPKYLIQLEACAEMKSTDQHQSENTMRNKSRWAMYLSSQSSPVHSCTVEGSNIEWKPEAQEDDINLNLKDLLVQERMQDFETCDEKGKKDNEDQPVDNTDQSWNQEEKVEILSFCESSSLLGSCSSADNNGLLSESNIQGNNEIPSNQNDKVCMEGSVCIGESAQVVNTCTTQQEHKQPVSSLLESEHLQMESFLSNKSRISNGVPDVFSKSSIDSESLNSVHGSVSNVTEPFLEINFNLSNFETSDTETESQEDNKISQDSERWVKEILAHDGNLCVQKRSEDTSCQEIGSECLPLLTSIDSRPADIFPIKETISQFCDKTCVGFDMGPYKDGNTGKETEEEYINTLSNFDSSLDWNDDVYIDNKEDANNSIKKVGINCDFASLSDKSKGINMNLHFPQFLDTVTNQSPKNDALFSEDVQPQTFILGSDLDKSDEQILPPISSSDKSIQLLTTNQEYVACDRFDTQDSNSLFYPLEKKHPISKDSEVYIPESEDSGRIGKLPHDHIEVATARKSKQSWNNSRNSSLSGVISNISLLKSLSEHSTALESLEILKKRNTAFQQQGIQQTYEPDSRPEARKPFTTVVSHMIPKSPDLKQDSQKILKEDEVEPHESFRSLQVKSPEQKFSTLSPVSTFSLNSKNEDVLEFSEESLKAKTLPGMKKFSSLKNKNLQRLPLQQGFSSQDLVSRKKALSLSLKQTSKSEEVQNVLGKSVCYNYSAKDLQEINHSELCFPSGQKVKCAYLPKRQIHIPTVFQSPAHYKQTFTSCIIEHLNLLLFELAQRLHKALSKVDISFYTSSKGEKLKTVENNLPSCHHNQPAKLVMVKKEGPNKGRLFYTCDRPKADQCKFFKWLEEVTPVWLTQEESQPSMVLSDIKSIGLYLRSQKIPLYEECHLLVRKGFDFQRKQYGKLKKFTAVNPEFYSEQKSKLYLKLSRKESSSIYSKDDLWVISKTLDFELDTFIACSVFFGPSSINEVELLPLKGYFPSNWLTNTVVHALLVCNASTELTTLKNIQDYFNPAVLPLMPYLLTMSPSTTVSNKRENKRKFIPPAFANINTKFELLSLEATLQLASELIQTHKLNEDQATALIQIAQMMASHDSVEEGKELHTHTLPITVIHGVFGAGKSYLLAVVILFFVQLFEKTEALTVANARPWKLLISSSTNVAVDRVLLGLLSLGFEKFIRVGSVRKIAKPILPYSLHAGSENENEQLKELHALMKEDLTPVERIYVRKSIEQHKLGTNKTLLKQVRVVGVTCAACPFPCMNDLQFPVVVLDECSQITEPASLLPIARFKCEKLILVGDPKQLPPTIQGSDAAHENGLEQTLFDRLCLMGHKPILLRTQYRCHPAISAIANDLFYEGNLLNGISETERSPLLEWLPTLCFYNVKGLEQIERDNSFHNVAEAAFTLKLIQSLIASGIASSMIGVITLYKSQMYKLCHLLSAVDFDHPNIKSVQVSTVDAFQGAEKEIIILSCVRTRQVGFIDSEKRMNVALTRGRRHLLIVGNLACLRKNRLWGHVIQHCEGSKNGLQHASQYEPHLNQLLKDYFEKQAEEKERKKTEKEKSKDKSHS
ncbi:protein ZGRF1 isoform X3 [Sciurus carolinensis]|uniref:protein ZGRF1 isoform X3 n=1 Tax=Sciurus carolinensis TaxID=30640 RepID=UPI001FB1DACB|nr:protein ZGRF1 isoform X3 [Sciurus carolinensis]